MKIIEDIHELSAMKVNFRELGVFVFKVDNFEELKYRRHINNIYLIIDGRYRYKYLDSDGFVDAGKRDILLLPRGSNYTRTALTSENFGNGICLDFNMVDENGEEILFSPEIKLLTNDSDGYYERMYREAINAQLDAHGEFAFRAAVYNLFSHLLSENDRFSAADCIFRDIAPAIKSIEQFPQNNLTVEELAKRCNVSQTRLRQLFKVYTDGLSPVEYRNSLRIAKAKELVSNAHNNYSLESIAEMLGFYDASYFIKTFTKLTGMTPKEYRSSMKSNI